MFRRPSPSPIKPAPAPTTPPFTPHHAAADDNKRTTRDDCTIVAPCGCTTRCKATVLWRSMYLTFGLAVLFLIVDGGNDAFQQSINQHDTKEHPTTNTLPFGEKLKQLANLPVPLLHSIQHVEQRVEDLMFQQTTRTTTTAAGHDQIVLPKVYVYDLPPLFNTIPYRKIQADKHAWKYYRYQSAEVYLHQRFLLDTSIRVTNPNDADLFLVPIYVSTLLSGNSHDLKRREKTRSIFLKGIEWLRTRHPFWDRYQGSDHMFVFTHDQGACMDIRSERNGETPLARQVTHVLRNSIHLSTMGDKTSDCFNEDRDVVIPPMIDPSIYVHQGGQHSQYEYVVRSAFDPDALLRSGALKCRLRYGAVAALVGREGGEGEEEGSSALVLCLQRLKRDILVQQQQQEQEQQKEQQKQQQQQQQQQPPRGPNANNPNTLQESARSNYWTLPFQHLVLFRGLISLEKKHNPWYSITMLYGSYHDQLTL
jgi:hypothetical protein